MLKVKSLDHLVLTVLDIPRSVRFYVDILGMRVERFQPADGSDRVALAFGLQKINLHAAACPFIPHAEVPMPGSSDLCFLTDSPLDDWQAHLDASSVVIEEGPIRRTGAIGPIMSLYIRDPDSNLIEISIQTD